MGLYMIPIKQFELEEMIGKIEKENNNMNSTTNLAGKSLFDTLKEHSDNFNKWVTESEKYLSGISTRNMNKEVSEENFGKKNANLGQAIIKESENFSNWIEMSTCLLCMLESMKKDTNNIDALNESLVDIEKVISAMADENDKYSFVDSLEIDLRNNTYFDASQWESDVKPVKAIISICMSKETTHNVMNDITDNLNKLGKSSNFDVNLTIGNMIFLMEDGTFRSVD